MLPSEVVAIADLVWPRWQELADDDPAQGEVVQAAWRIHNAGYRRPDGQEKTQIVRPQEAQ